MITAISIGVGLTIIEIVVDILIWKRKGNDKPYTTIVRIVLMVIAAWIIGNFWNTLFVIFATHFLVFDFSLNISRWKKITGIFYYRPYHESVYKLIKDGFNEQQAHDLTMGYLTRKERYIYHFMNIKSKVFYHGVDKSFKKLDEFYDALFMKIAPIFELLIKGILFGTSIYLI